MVCELTPPEAASFDPDIWDSDPSGRCGARDLVADALSRSLALKGAASHSGRRTFITKAAKRCIEGVAACGTFGSLPGMKASTTQRYIEAALMGILSPNLLANVKSRVQYQNIASASDTGVGGRELC